jgi:hypothetical protein
MDRMRWTLLITLLALVGCETSVAPLPEMAAPRPIFAHGDGDTDGSDFLIWQQTLDHTQDIIIYDIQNGFVYTGSSQQGNLLLNLREGAIYDATNTSLLCRFDGRTLVDASTGRVLFTTDGKVIYQGGTRTLGFFFKKELILQGEKRSAEVVGVASVDLTRVSDERKLLVAALFSATCGAPPLDS